MKVLFIHERVSGDGAVERTTSQFDQDELLIGRGGASDIVVSSSRIGLVHAKLFQEDSRLVIADLDSLAGIRVNNTRVARHILSAGDVVQLGDLSFSIQISPDLLTLTLRTHLDDAISDAEIVARNARRLVIDSYLPSMRGISLVAIVVVLAGCFVYPIVKGRYSGWSSGPVANAHRMIEHDCQRCHLSPFERVEDRECLNCHTMSEHAKGYPDFVASHKGVEVRCAQCHMEHNGDHGLVLRDSRQCVSCHADMKNPGRDVLHVANFAHHPEFRVSLVDGAGKMRRVNVTESEKVVDTTPIKLNHALHLQEGLRGPQGATTLQCKACHQLAKDTGQMMPIRFDAHCRECHSLGFDERLPDSQLPHGDGEVVYPTLFAEYAKLLLLEGGARKSDGLRILPGGGDSPDSAQPLSPDAKLVQSNARRTEEEVFTRTGCFLCHDYREKPLSEQGVGKTRYTITKPEIPSVWMTKARFDHGAHEETSCESCHEKTRKSSETRDLLLPSIAVCRQCHMQDAGPGFVESQCGQCHAYHTALEVPREKKQNLTEFLHALTR